MYILSNGDFLDNLRWEAPTYMFLDKICNYIFYVTEVTQASFNV